MGGPCKRGRYGRLVGPCKRGREGRRVGHGRRRRCPVRCSLVRGGPRIAGHGWGRWLHDGDRKSPELL